MSFPNPDNYARDCDCGTAGANTTPPPASLVAEAEAAILTNPFILPDGGTIHTSNGGNGDGGSINTYAGAGGDGGSINTYGEIASGGSIDTHGEEVAGGYIYTFASGSATGGYINTSGATGAGGNINTSSGGGSINTRGTGSIELGVSATRTTLNGSATNARTVTLPNITGTLPIALISTSTALNFGPFSASGGFASLTVTLTGAAVGDVVFVTCLDAAGRGATDGKLIFEAFVSAANTVTVRAHNPSSANIDPASYDFKVAIIKTI